MLNMKKNKQGRNFQFSIFNFQFNKEISIISIIGGALAILLIVLISLPDPNKNPSAGLNIIGNGPKSDIEYNADNSTLINYPADLLAQIEIKNREGTFTLTREGDSFAIAELAGLPIDVDFIRIIWADAAQIGYSYSLRERGDLSQYGFDPPQATVTGWYSDGSTSEFYIGNTVSGDEAYRYFMVTGDELIYVTDLHPSFLLGASYWLSKEPFGVGSGEGEVTSLTISGQGFSTPAIISKHATTDESNPFYNLKYVMTSPFEWGCDDYFLSLLTYELGSLRADLALCPFPAETDLETYGLKNPRCVISFTREGIDYTVRCSSLFGGVFYITFDSIPVIYKLNADSYLSLSDLNQNSILSVSPRVLSFKTVAELTIIGRGRNYNFVVDRTTISDNINISDDPNLYEYRVTSSGNEIPLSSFKNLLQTINGAVVVEFGAQSSAQEPELTITIRYHPEYNRSEETMSYFSTGNRRFVCDINGQRTGAAVQSLWIDSVFEIVAVSS